MAVSPKNGVPSRQTLPPDTQTSPPVDQAGRLDNAHSDLKAAVSELSAHVQNWQRDLKFSVDKDLGRTVVMVVDSQTHEVIRQIPAEEVLAMARFLAERTDDKEKIEGLLLKAHA